MVIHLPNMEIPLIIYLDSPLQAFLNFLKKISPQSLIAIPTPPCIGHIKFASHVITSSHTCHSHCPFQWRSQRWVLLTLQETLILVTSLFIRSTTHLAFCRNYNILYKTFTLKFKLQPHN